MMFCCLWHNVETSCHKHFVVVSRHQQTPPLTTSDKCHNFPRSGGIVLIMWQHAMKPDIGSEWRFMPTPHAFDAPVRGFPSEHNVCGKTRMVWLPDGKKIWRYVYSFWQNPRTWQTDTHTHRDTAWRHRPRLRSIARQKLYIAAICFLVGS